MCNQQYLPPSVAVTGDTTGYMNVLSSTPGGELQVVTTGATVNTIGPDRNIVIGDVLVGPGHYKTIPTDYHVDGDLTIEALAPVTIGSETVKYEGYLGVDGYLNCTGTVDNQGTLFIYGDQPFIPPVPTPELPITTSLVAHYMADEGVTAAGGFITQWNDQSGNGHHLYASGDETPLYGDIQLNGRYVPNTVAGWASDSPRKMVTTTQLTDVGPTGTVFLVGAQYVGETFYNYFMDTSNLDGILIARNSGNEQIGGSIDNSNDPPYISIAAADNARFYTIRLTGNGTNSKVVLNGAIEGQNFPQSGGSVNGVLTLFNGTNNRPGRKAIAEIIIYSDLLSSGDIAAVEDYLVSRWNHY